MKDNRDNMGHQFCVDYCTGVSASWPRPIFTGSVGDFLLRTVIDVGATGIVWHAYKSTRIDKLLKKSERELVETEERDSKQSLQRGFARNLAEGSSVAIKIIKRDRFNSELEFFSYYATHQLAHENIVKYYGSMKSQRSLYLVLELCDGGTLHDLVHGASGPRNSENKAFDFSLQANKASKAVAQRSVDNVAFEDEQEHEHQTDNNSELRGHELYLPEDVVRIIAKQLAVGLAHLHRNRVIHSDIKPKNLFLSKESYSKKCDSPVNTKIPAYDGRGASTQPKSRWQSTINAIREGSLVLKIGDFGAAKKLRAGTSSTTSRGGTTLYMAPEVLSQAPQNTTLMCDMWSVGATVYEMLFRDLPFKEINLEKQYQLIQQTRGVISLPSTRPISQECRHLLSALLSVNRVDRLSAEELTRHPFFADTSTHDTLDD